MVAHRLGVLLATATLATSAGAQDVPLRIRASDGVHLAATLSVPPGPRPHPAVLLIAGFGPHDRGGRLQDDSYAKWSEALLRRGIAVLRYDKRGIADSEGDALAWLDPTVLEADAVDAARALAARAEVDQTRIAIIGHSQGGDIALVAGAAAPSVDRVVTLAAPARPLSAYARGGIEIVRRLAGPRAAAAIARANPQRDARALRAPLLIVHGDADRTVPVGDSLLLSRARRSTGLPTRRAIVPGLGHQLLNESAQVPPGLAARIARFVRTGA